MSELIVIEKENISGLSVEGGTEYLLEGLREKASSFDSDISTKEGREKLRSFAFKFTKAKTDVVKLVKGQLEEKKKAVKEADAECKRYGIEVDTIRDEVRSPLTEWENVEKRRIEDIKTWIQEIVTMGEIEYPALEDIQTNIKLLEDIKIEMPVDPTYGEFAGLATRKIATAITNLSAMYIVLKKAEDDAAEAKRFEAKRIEDDRIARDKEVADKAAEDARKQAEEEAAEAAKEEKRLADKAIQDEKDKADEKDRLAKKAIADAEAKEAAAEIATARAKREKKEAADKAVKDAVDAKKKAAIEKAAAVEDERQKAAEVIKLQEDAALKREADETHRAKIADEIMEDVWKQIADDEPTKQHVANIVDAMIAGRLRHVKVIF
jgi:colicin import membrane protein